MVSRSDDPGRPRRRGVLRHYHRPLRADRVFLLVLGFSLVATVAFVGVVLLLTGVPTRAVDWLRPVVVGVLVFLLSFRLLGMGVTTSRSFSEGVAERPSTSTAGDPADGPGGAETAGRAAGAVVGRALRSTRRAPGAAPADEGSDRAEGRGVADGPPAPPPAAPAAPGSGARSETDRVARAAGAVVGRRLAERRRGRERR